jgi:di/tricarboxylate transporter
MQRHLTEVVLSPSSPLVGLSIKEADFRKLYAAAVVAVHRNGSRLPSKLGDSVLESGDTLLIQTKNKFADSYRNSRDFYLVSSVEGAEPRQHDKAPLAIAILIGLVAWLTAGSLFGGGESWANPPICALLAMMLMIVTRCMRFSDVRNTLDVQLILTIALALGMGEAMRSSGAAAMLARFTTSIVSDPFLVLVAIYVTSMILTEMISNAAVAAIMIPIAISVATSSGSDARPFIMAVAIAASLAFITPIGYQTNLMVMGPGGYRPSDYLKCGLPLSLLVAVTAIVMLRIVYGF